MNLTKRAIISAFGELLAQRPLNKITVRDIVVHGYVDTTTTDLFPASSRERELLIRYYKCTLVGVILDWLDAGMGYDLLAGAASICELFAGAGKQAFLKCVESPQRLTAAVSPGRPN